MNAERTIRFLAAMMAVVGGIEILMQSPELAAVALLFAIYLLLTIRRP